MADSAADTPLRRESFAPATRRRVVDSCIEALRDAILNGDLAPGSQLPTEKELLASFGVSRNTVREALNAIEQAGLIVRRQGLGTFVAAKSLTEDLNTNASITEMLRASGYQTGVRDLKVSNGAATAEEAEALGLGEDTDVIRVRRIHTANLRPVVQSVDVLATGLIGLDVLRDGLTKGRSLYALLHEHDANVAYGVATVAPVPASAEVAAALDVDKGRPLLRLKQRDHRRTGDTLVFSVEHHVPEFFSFQIHRRGPYA